MNVLDDQYHKPARFTGTGLLDWHHSYELIKVLHLMRAPGPAVARLRYRQGSSATERNMLSATRRDNLSSPETICRRWICHLLKQDRHWPRAKNLCDHEQGPRRILHLSWRVVENDQDIGRLPANAHARLSLLTDRPMHRSEHGSASKRCG